MKKKDITPEEVVENIVETPPTASTDFVEEVSPSSSPDITPEPTITSTIETVATPDLVTVTDDKPAAEPTVSEPVPQINLNDKLKIEDSPSESDEIPTQEKNDNRLFLFGSISSVVIVLVVSSLAFLYFKNKNQSSSKVAETKTTITPSVTPTVTEAPKITLKKSEIGFEILNASGVTGEAAKYGKQLEALGYKVDSLGNTSDQTGITLYLSKSLDSQKDELIADLKKQFPSATFSSSISSSTSLVQLVIGK